MTEGENQKPGTVGSEGDVTPPITPEPIEPTAKVEVKDGKVLVDGKAYVAEHHLIAAKQGLETAAEKAQTAHNEAIDAVRLELSAAQQQAANLNAKLEEAQNAQGKGATPDEEVARIKTELTDALSKVETLKVDADKSLELRRALLVIQYGITAESLAEKDMKALDSFEGALKALATSRGGGPGPYALGGGLGGVAQMTEQERAAKVLEATPVLGVREAEPAK